MQRRIIIDAEDCFVSRRALARNDSEIDVKSTLLLILEITLILVGLGVYALDYLPFPILLLFLMAWASLRLRHMHWRDVGLRRPDRWLTTIGLALLIGIGYQALDIILIAPIMNKLTGEAIDLSLFNDLEGNLFLLFFFLAVSWTEAAFIEELFFRGYLFNRITDLFGKGRLGVSLALIGTSLLFGAAHAYQGISGVVDTALAGLLLGLLYLHARRNLWLPILTHGIIDTIGFLFIYFGFYG
jgi:membrane protease YdiL (CAAX protease family)